MLALGAGLLPPEEIGTLAAAYFLLALVFQPLQELSDLYSQLQSATAAMIKVSTVLDTEPEIRSPERPRQIRAARRPRRVRRRRFAYGSNEVLHGIDLVIPEGGCTALVGESGGGKSTLAKLAARFYDPLEGAILADGMDLRELDLRAYRRQLGVVLQDPFLFSGTIADNIRFAHPDASDDEVAETAAMLGLDRLARRFPEGLGHPVREGGSGLSAGERQLISIARALLADPRILILDEATSNIDRPTELLIERALDRLLRGRTSLIIAHRLSTVRARRRDRRDRSRADRRAGPRGGAARGRRAVPPARPLAGGERLIPYARSSRQAAACPSSPASNSAGSSESQGSKRCGQRGCRRQPGGMCAASGGSPGSSFTPSPRPGEGPPRTSACV